MGLFYWRADDQFELRVVSGPEISEPRHQALTSLPMSDPLVRRVQSASGALVFADAAASPEVNPSALVVGAGAARFLCAVPVSVAGRLRGLLCVGDKTPRALGAVAHDALIESLSHWAAIAASLIEQQYHLRRRERAEREYLRYKNRHETHIQNTPVAFVQWNADFEVTGWNPAAESVFGYSEVEALGRDIVDLIVLPDGRPEVRKRLGKLLAGANEPYAINENQTKDGRTILCEWYNTPLNDETGAVYGGISLALDITDRMEAHQALEERERDLAVTLNSIGDAVIATDAAGRITRMNPVAEELTGWTFADAKGRLIDEVIRLETGETGQLYPGAFEAVIETGRIHAEARPAALVRRDGTRCQISDSIAPIRTADGEMRGAVLVFSDATEQYQREQELRQAREIAEEMNQLKSAFLANMSHEIRTPLTTIIGFAEIVEEETRSAAELAEAGEFAALIRRSGQRLLETINSVLDLSRLEAGTVHLHPRQIDIGREVHETIDLFRPRSEDAGIRLEVDVPEAPLHAFIDPAGVHRIMVNLVGNALKFTEPGGRITVSAFAEGGESVIEVQDTGVGIDPEFVPALFGAFQQESMGRARLHEGSGLGLAITQQLVELMSGTIEVESEKGEGTVFTVRLPQAAAS